MRLLIAVELYAVLHVFFFAGLEPIASYSTWQALAVSSLLAIYVMWEAVRLIKSIENREQTKAVATRMTQAAESFTLHADEEHVKRLEGERDELRKQNERLFLAERQIQEKHESLERRLQDAALLAGGSRSEAAQLGCVDLLSLLQERGRLVDFLMSDISTVQDQQVGAASRVVHEGCRSALQEHMEIKPLYGGSEGEEIALERTYDPRRYRLVGRSPAGGELKGKILHRGWELRKVSLPGNLRVGDQIIMPVEVEVE